MTETISIETDGADAARQGLEKAIGAGEVVVFPADGLYGLACDPLNSKAIERIHELKGRPEDKPAAVLYFSSEAMRELLGALAPLTRAAVAALLPGPVTLVVYNPERRYPLACGKVPERLGIRMIEGPLVGAKTPVYQTSANRSGAQPPGAFGAIDVQILAGADLVIDGGELTGEASTVVDLTEIEAGGAWEILREGAMSYEDLERSLTGLQLGG